VSINAGKTAAALFTPMCKRCSLTTARIYRPAVIETTLRLWENQNMAKKRKSKNKSFLQKLIYIFLAIILVYSVLHYLGLTQEFDTKVQNALNKASSYTEQNAQPQQQPKTDASETSVTKEASSKQTAQDSEQNSLQHQSMIFEYFARTLILLANYQEKM